jgi:hypothetical protein
VLMLVLKGRVFLDTGKEGMGMREPPGVARFHWDSRLRKHSFQHLDKFPETLIKPMTDEETKILGGIETCCAKMSNRTLGIDRNQSFDFLAKGRGYFLVTEQKRLREPLEQYLQEVGVTNGQVTRQLFAAFNAKMDFGLGLDLLIDSKNSLERQLGVTLAGAVDDLPRVFGVLMYSKDADTRDQAVIVLRHWLGREPGQVKKFEEALIATNKVTPVQARNVLQLFFGFNAEERRDPDTYVLLLHYLAHKNQAIRTLAHWHLVRLAPAGKSIDFDAAGPEAARQSAVERWHALIPEGHLPPSPLKQQAPKTP